MMENIAVEIEEEPDTDVKRRFKCDRDEQGRELLGLYRGVPLTDRGNNTPIVPDRITIYRGPISRVARSRDEVVQRVRDTVIHEIGHYFGLSDAEMPH